VRPGAGTDGPGAEVESGLGGAGGTDGTLTKIDLGLGGVGGLTGRGAQVTELLLLTMPIFICFAAFFRVLCKREREQSTGV